MVVMSLPDGSPDCPADCPRLDFPVNEMPSVRPGDRFGEPARLFGDLDCAPGPAFHAGFGDGVRELLPTLPDRADPGLAFRPGDVPRRGGALLALWRLDPGVGEPARLNDFAPRPL